MLNQVKTKVAEIIAQIAGVQKTVRTTEAPIADLRRALVAARAAVEAAANEFQQLAATRPRLLVDGDDAELAALDAEMATARRSRERGEAMIPLLEEKLAAAEYAADQAERRERAEKLKPIIDAFEAKYLADYAPAVEKLKALAQTYEETRDAFYKTAGHLPDDMQISDIADLRRLLDAFRFHLKHEIDALSPPRFISNTYLIDNYAAVEDERNRQTHDMLWPKPVIHTPAPPPVCLPSVTLVSTGREPETYHNAAGWD